MEHNPLYLFSGALVLGGVNLISRNLTEKQSAVGLLGAAAIAELYAWALIGGAALLTRMRLRRPALMLALIAALYQCDPTLHTETCALLGATGAIAVAVWLASFVAKLFALAWAVEVRLSPSALAVPVLGALGFAIVPRALSPVADTHTSSLIAWFVFLLFASAFWSSRRVTSKRVLDAWGRTVLRRALRAVWLIWAVLALAHVFFWCDEFGARVTVFVPVALLLATRFIRRERGVWGAVSATLAFVAYAMPGAFSITAGMAAVVLTLRALRKPSVDTRSEPAAEPTPYRTSAQEAPPVVELPGIVFMLAERAAIARLLTGALSAVYLAVWARGWSTGPFPPHVLRLDLVFTLALVLMFWKARARIAALPLGSTYFHVAVQTKLISAPQTALEWGFASVGLGFVLLLGSLLTSWMFSRTAALDRD